MHHDRSLARVAHHLLNQPLACTDEHAVNIISSVRSELNVALLTTVDGHQLGRADMDARVAAARRGADSRSDRRGQSKVFDSQDGVAVIPVTGTLTKTWGLDPYSGMTGYDGIKAKVWAALEDDDIDALMYDIDSPGGAVAGMLDLSDLMWSANAKNGGKLSYAIANEQCCSAAFALGSAADKLFVPRTGQVGSVGVLTLHSDVSKALDKEGIKVTVLRAGANKAQGNPYEALDPKVAAKITADLEGMRELFIDTVARNLNMSKKAVRDTEADTYIGEKATGIGFATAVASDDQVWTQLMKRLGRT